ncbi:MAG TPA: AbrB/MazE/SpoVT family DNA-binding domain-containing protein [Acetobacteraceae bacterium]|nr:AbrB/MazE/SpoVT family DNA-binding domain-containing protein [Acetobacteraceae bacterium]
MIVTVSKWGNSLGVRIPKEVASQLGLRNGSPVEVVAEQGRIVISPRRPRFTLNELLANVTPEIRDAFDWGPDKGREIIGD